MDSLRSDEVGYWAEVKLDIVRDYAKEYSKILAAQKGLRGHVYIDAFAGAGVHLSKTTGEFIPGSPLNALLVQPPFQETAVAPRTFGNSLPATTGLLSTRAIATRCS